MHEYLSAGWDGNNGTAYRRNGIWSAASRSRCDRRKAQLSRFPFSPAVEALDLHADNGLRAGFLTSAGAAATWIRSTTAEPDQLRILGSWLNELSGGRTNEEDQSNLFLQREPPKNADAELRELRKIISELVALLNGKHILDDSEGMSLLRKLAKELDWTIFC